MQNLELLLENLLLADDLVVCIEEHVIDLRHLNLFILARYKQRGDANQLTSNHFSRNAKAIKQIHSDVKCVWTQF